MSRDEHPDPVMRSVEALAFDAYGTLFDVHSVTAALEATFPGRGSELSHGWRSRQLQYTWLRALMGRYEDFWAVTEAALQATCDSLGLACPAATRAALMEAYLRLDAFPEVKGALAALAAYRLAILSNGTPRMLQALVERAGLADAFSHVISVDEVRTYKPRPEVYQLAVRRLGVAKEAIGFVSSNYWDVVGAKSFGFPAFWVNRTGAVPDALGLVPDRTLTTLADLPAAIRG